MDGETRGALFTDLVGMELKGVIVTHGFTANKVAKAIGKTPSVLSNWLNGKRAIPLLVICDVCDVIGADPCDVVSAAYKRLEKISPLKIRI